MVSYVYSRINNHPVDRISGIALATQLELLIDLILIMRIYMELSTWRYPGCLFVANRCSSNDLCAEKIGRYIRLLTLPSEDRGYGSIC